MAVPDDPQGIPQRPVVLAVDDLPANLAVASAMLEALDVDIRLAENGQSALAQAEATPQPDLIQLDRFVEAWFAPDAQNALQALVARLGK